ncbi:hypothetical protein LTR04_003529, partial [Oleoguttula sp. CCFEE 6159]
MAASDTSLPSGLDLDSNQETTRLSSGRNHRKLPSALAPSTFQENPLPVNTPHIMNRGGGAHRVGDSRPATSHNGYAHNDHHPWGYSQRPPHAPSIPLPPPPAYPVEPPPTSSTWTGQFDIRLGHPRPDPFRHSGTRRVEPQGHYQQLPRVQDLLSPNPLPSHHDAPSRPWSGNAPGYGRPDTTASGPSSVMGQHQSYQNSYFPPNQPAPPASSNSDRRPDLPAIDADKPPAAFFISRGRSASASPVPDHLHHLHEAPSRPARQSHLLVKEPTSGRNRSSLPARLDLSAGPGTSMQEPGGLSTMTRELTSEPPSNVRCVGEREFPGEGICYVYEDGSHCRKVIDGEVVNPNWRTTKAGKARKRQPLACMACRRKKIKCEPGDPSCVSCEKSNQVCRVSRTHEVSIEARPTVSREQTASSPVKRALAIAGRYPTLDDASRSDARKRRRSQEHKTQSPTLSPAREQPVASSFMTDSPKLIRPRSPVISWGMVTGEAKDDTTDYRSKSSADTPKIEPLGTVSNVVNEHRKTDPYNVDPELTLYLLDLYFTHINSATY